jgi:aspartate aminotransferase
MGVGIDMMRLNLNVRGLKPSATVAINEHCEVLRQRGTRICRLGLGQSPFPVPDPVVAALRSNADQKSYLAVKGLPALREAVAGYVSRTQRVEGDADDVLIGPGSKELMFLLQLVYYGEIVIPSPAWVSYAPQAQIVGRQVAWIHTSPADAWKLQPEALDRAWADDPTRPRLLVLNYPDNPTGATYLPAELEALAEVCRKYNAVVLSDEIYGELHYQGRHVSIARYYPDGTIISSGLSKWCGAGGWRLGTFFFPRSLRWLLDAMAAVASETYTSVSAPIQYAAVRAFQGGMDIERYLTNSRRILAALTGECQRRLTAAGVAVVPPAGSFYLFPDFTPLTDTLARRGLKTSAALCTSLLDDTGVAILPGGDFARPATELTARMALVDFDGAKAMAAVNSLSPDAPVDLEFLTNYCGPVIDGIDRTVEWLTIP